MNSQFDVAKNITEPIPFIDFKELVISASMLMSKGEILELADALHDALRARRTAAEKLAPALT